MFGNLSIIDIGIMIIILAGAGVFLYRILKGNKACSCSDCHDVQSCCSSKK